MSVCDTLTRGPVLVAVPVAAGDPQCLQQNWIESTRVGIVNLLLTFVVGSSEASLDLSLTKVD